MNITNVLEENDRRNELYPFEIFLVHFVVISVLLVGCVGLCVSLIYLCYECFKNPLQNKKLVNEI